jgi:hypothetical protein
MLRDYWGSLLGGVSAEWYSDCGFFADPPEDVDGPLEEAGCKPMGRRQRKCGSVIESGNEDLRRLADLKRFSEGASLAARQGYTMDRHSRHAHIGSSSFMG